MTNATMNHYLCFTDYVATGEGATIWLSLECEKTSKLAKNAHIKRFDINEYFHCGVQVINVKKKQKVKDVLSSFFSVNFIDFLSNKRETSDEGKLFDGFNNDFAFTFHLNRS